MAAADYNNVVQQLYVAYFGRPADPVGLMNFTNSLNNISAPTTIGELTAAYNTNTSIKSLIDSFGTSTESAALYTGSTAAFVNSIFTNVLGRSPALEGLLFWSNAIDSGALTRGNAAAAIMAGAQTNTSAQGVIDAAVVANKVTVAANFTAALDTAAEVIAYSGSTAAATARSMLASVVDTTDTTAFQTTVTSTVSTIVAAPSTTGQSFTMATSTDNVSGTAGNDTITAAYSAVNGMSFQATDSIDGGSGTDTLSLGVGTAIVHQAASLKNVETITANFTAAGTVSLLGSTGVTALEAIGSTATATFSNIGSATTTLKVSNTDQDASFGFTAAAVAGTADTANVTVSGTTTGVALTINGATGNLETVAITSSGSSNILDSLTTTNATKLTVAGDQSLTVTAALEASIVTIDASAQTAGGVTATLGAAATVTGGAGNDSITLGAAAAAESITAGAGNDTITFAANLGATDTINGGDGTDTLVTVSAAIEAIDGSTTAHKISNVEVIQISDDATGAQTLLASNIGATKVVLAEDTAGAYGVTFATGGGTVVLGAGAAGDGGTDALGGDVTITANGTATTDTAAFEYGTATADGNAKNLATSGVETLTITNTKVADTIGTITMSSVSTGGASKVVFTGDKTMTVGAVTAATVDASALTSTAALVMTAASVGATSITGSANADTLYGIAASASTISGGAGNDSIVGGSAADNVTAGTGDDTVIGAAGNDVITAGDGNDRIDVSGGAGAVNVDGGVGNDTVILGGTLTATDTLNGGDGTDILSITAADITTASGMTFADATTLLANLSNFEKLSIADGLATSGTATNILDMTRFDSITNIVLNADGAAATQIAGVADATTIEFASGAMTATDVLTVALNSTTGTNTVSLKLNGAAANNEYGKATIAGVEVFNIESTSSDAATTTDNTIDLTISSATTVTITGAELLDLTGAVINATTVDASAATGGVKFTGSSANQTITGTATTDTLDGGAGADTISGGSGVDVLNGGSGADNITGGDGADVITGGSGNDTISLTETTAAVDDVVISSSEAGVNVDTISGFVTGASGDELQFSLAALEAVATSGGIATGATNFVMLGDATAEPTVAEDVTAAASVVQVLTGAGATAAAATANVFALSGTTFSTGSEVEDALEAGGAYELTLGAAGRDLAGNAFIVVYTDGTNAHVAAVHVQAVTAADTNFEAGNLKVVDLATLTGVTTIGASTFNLANFEFIA